MASFHEYHELVTMRQNRVTILKQPRSSTFSADTHPATESPDHGTAAAYDPQWNQGAETNQHGDNQAHKVLRQVHLRTPFLLVMSTWVASDGLACTIEIGMLDTFSNLPDPVLVAIAISFSLRGVSVTVPTCRRILADYLSPV
jgi:hypothetical protein